MKRRKHTRTRGRRGRVWYDTLRGDGMKLTRRPPSEQERRADDPRELLKDWETSKVEVEAFTADYYEVDCIHDLSWSLRPFLRIATPSRLDEVLHAVSLELAAS